MGRLNKAKWCLFGCLIIVLVLVASSVFIPFRLTDGVQWVANNDLAGELRALIKQEETQEGKPIEMIVDTVGISRVDYKPVVLLREKGGELYLPIWIGPLEATAISVVLEGVEVPRPLTPDLLCSIIDRTGASVDYIVINDFQNSIFYAKVVLHADWKQMDIDARPSDAIAVALRTGAPIYAAKSVLEEAGVPFSREADKFTITHTEKASWVQPIDVSSLNHITPT